MAGHTTKIVFKFANWDNTVSPVEMELPETTSVREVKKQLLPRWPAALSKPDAASAIMLIVMGRLLEDTDNLAGIPKYDWPTPIHVTIRGAVVKAAPGGGASAGAAATAAGPAGAAGGSRSAAGGAPSTAVTDPHRRHHEEDASGCCVIS